MRAVTDSRRTYYVVQSFTKDRQGKRMDAPIEARTQESAIRTAERLAQRKASVIVFGRTGDPTSGEFDEPVVLASYGDDEELPF